MKVCTSADCNSASLLSKSNVELACRCIVKHALHLPLSVTSAPPQDAICTEFTAQLLIRLGILSNQCHACLKPKFFETNEINQYIINKTFHYDCTISKLNDETER